MGLIKKILHDLWVRIYVIGEGGGWIEASLKFREFGYIESCYFLYCCHFRGLDQ